MLNTIPLNKLVEFRAKVAELTVAPETQVPSGQDEVIAGIINQRPEYASIAPIQVADIRRTFLFANVLPLIEANAKNTDAKGIAARSIQCLWDSNNTGLDPVAVERIAWLEAQLAALVTGNVISSLVKDAVVGLSNVQVSWAIHHLGDIVDVSLVSQNKP